MLRSLNLKPLIRIALFVVPLVSFWLPSVARSAEQTEEIQVVADDLQYMKDEGKIVATGNVVVVQEDTELASDRAEVYIQSKQANASGHVVLKKRDAGTLSSEEVFFDFEKSEGSFPNGRFYQFPWYGQSEQMRQVKKNVIKAENVFITSCDLPHPHYDLKARKATIYPGDKIVATNVFFRILEVPVFWWPYLVIPLNHHLGGLSPGYSNDYGFYLLAQKGIAINKNIQGKLLFDWYSKRGFGYGAELAYKFKRLGVGEVKIYGIRDHDAPDDRAANPFEEKNRKNEDRGRFTWKHKGRIDDLTTLQFQWNELSDDVFLQDFFEQEHRREIDPKSYVTVTRNSSQYSLLANLEKRTNRFQSVNETLPELVFTWLRRPLFGTNFYYTNEEGFVNFKETQAFRPKVRDTMQLYTDHELSYPLSLFRFYSFVPFINFREDVYTKGSTEEESISRFLAGGGFDLNTRFYREWNYDGKWFGMDIHGLRHVLEPIIQYNSIQVATESHKDITNTGRGDNLDHQDIVTFGVENRIQTKQTANHSADRVDLVSFNTFLDFSFGTGSDLLPTRQNRFTQARVETILRPYQWCLIRNNTTYDLVKNEVAGNNLDLVFDPNRLNFNISHRFSSGGDSSSDNLLTLNVDYLLNERWKVGAYLRWDASNSSIEEWELRGTRDLHDWLFDFGYNVRNSDRTGTGQELNKELFFDLKLKALEDIRLKSGHRASFSGPRIGRTVAGANEVPVNPSWYSSLDTQHVSTHTP